MRQKMISTLALVVACLTTTTAQSGPVTFTFSGSVVQSFNSGSSVGSADYVPPIGTPLSIVMLLDEHLAPVPEGNAPYPGTTTKYVMNGSSFIDFGFRPEFRFSDFYVRVVNDNIGNSAPDRLTIIRDEHIVQSGVPEVWFNLEFDSASPNFLSGSDLPTSLDLSLTQGGGDFFGPPRGTIFVSTNGQTTNSSKFVITSVSSSEASQPIPEPSTLALALSGLLVLCGSITRKSSHGALQGQCRRLFRPLEKARYLR